MNAILFLLLFILFESIIARGPPVLLKETSNLIIIEVRENEPFELRCPVILTPDLSFQWSKNNEELDPMWSSSNLLIRRFLLKFHRAHITDAGLYKCNAVNGFGNVQAQFQVNIISNETLSNNMINAESQNIVVWDAKSFDGEAPKFLLRSPSSEIESTRVIQSEGTTVQFKCLASGKPTPEVRWKKNGKILSEDEYGITQSQILTIKDLRQTDNGNYTCEIFNSFGTINATYILIVTEQLRFFGNDPQNVTVEIGQTTSLNCRVQTNDPTTKIYWLKKLDNQQLFRIDSIVLDSVQYEQVEQSQDQEYLNNLVSKPLIFPQIHLKESGQYTCLIQNTKGTNYRSAFITVIDTHKGKVTSSNNYNILLYAIGIPFFILGFILFLIFCFSRHQRQNTNNRQLPSTDTLKSTTRPRQPLIHHNDVMFPSTKSHTSNDYLADSVDSIPVHRQYYQQRFGPSNTSDLGSLTGSNPYYARMPAL